MWNKILKQLSRYPDAVMTVKGAAGYPFSMKCKPQPDTPARVLRLELPDDANIQPGPAGLLCHKHNEWLYDMTSFGVRGSIERDEVGWFFIPRRFVKGADMSISSMWSMMTGGRKRSNRYLEKRGLSRPDIPWNKIKSWYKDAKKTK